MLELLLLLALGLDHRLDHLDLLVGDGVPPRQRVGVCGVHVRVRRPSTWLVLLILGRLRRRHSPVQTVAVKGTNIRLVNATAPVRDEHLLRWHFELILEDDLMVMVGGVMIATWQCMSVKFFRLVMDARPPRQTVRLKHLVTTPVFMTSPMVVNLLNVPPQHLKGFIRKGVARPPRDHNAVVHLVRIRRCLVRRPRPVRRPVRGRTVLRVVPRVCHDPIRRISIPTP